MNIGLVDVALRVSIRNWNIELADSMSHLEVKLGRCVYGTKANLRFT